jgi:hypothetical protein
VCARHGEGEASGVAAAEGRRRLRVDGRRDGSLHKNGTEAGRGRGVLRLATDGSSAAHGSRRQQGKEKGRRQRCSPAGLKGKGLDAVAGRCRWVGAVQGAWQRRGRRTGRRPGEAPGRGGGVLLLLLVLTSSFSSSLCGGGERETGASRVWGEAASGFLCGGPRVRGWLRPGVLDGRAGTRGGIAAAAARG